MNQSWIGFFPEIPPPKRYGVGVGSFLSEFFIFTPGIFNQFDGGKVSSQLYGQFASELR
jgi:hypothetical protein